MNMTNIKLIVTDLDGTLLTNEKTVSEKDRLLLEKAQQKGVITAIATGRNLYKTNQVVSREMPFDYAIVSSGAGVFNWEQKDYESIRLLDKQRVDMLCSWLMKRDHSFFLFDQLPNNHLMLFHRSRVFNSDFEAYMEANEQHAQEMTVENRYESATQLMVSIPENEEEFALIKKSLEEEIEGVQVIRSTSQLDDRFIWIEIFAHAVSKGEGIDFLCKKYNIQPDEVIGVGNDYNDIEMLDYAGHAYITSNAPDLLKRNGYKLTASNEESGVAQAILNHIG
ncbi:HAD family phosphatase [Prolixibacteraceae bacterium JC049]|nr:HAD family phosphatase [Prolixibacteraceae bacterium JC049]